MPFSATNIAHTLLRHYRHLSATTFPSPSSYHRHRHASALRPRLSATAVLYSPPSPCLRLYAPRSYTDLPSPCRSASLCLRPPPQKYIKSTPIKVQWLSPLHCIFITSISKSQSLITQTFSEDEEVAHQVLNEILSQLKGDSSLVNELCIDHIITLCRKRKLHAAARLLQLLRDEHGINNLQAYNLLLAAASEENNLKIISNLFKDMLVYRIPMNSTTYLNVAKAFSNSSESKLVLVFVQEISELTFMTFTSSVTIINRIIYAFAECGDVDKALLIFDHMKSLKCSPDLITFNTVLGILGKAARVDEMLQMFASMKEANIIPDIVSYNTLLNSLRKVGRLDACVVFIKEMVMVGLEPDLRTYTALIESFGRAGNIEESLRLFEDMKKRHICPSIYVYRSIISNLKRMRKLELSNKFLEEMNANHGDLVGPKDFKSKNR